MNFSAVGIATVEGTLTATSTVRELAGSPSGASTVRSVRSFSSVEGEAAGSSIVTGNLGSAGLLSTSAGSSTVGGTLLVVHNLTGISFGSGWATATPYSSGVSSSSGATTVTGTLTVTGVQIELVGDSDGTSSITGWIGLIDLSGATYGNSLVYSVRSSHDVRGDGVAGTSTLSGALSVVGTIEGASAGTSTTVGSLFSPNVRGLETLDAWHQASDEWVLFDTDIAFLMTICYLPGGPRGITLVEGGFDPFGFAGSSAGSSSTTSDLTGPPTVLIAGTSTVTGDLELFILAGRSDGSSHVGVVRTFNALSGVSDGSSLVNDPQLYGLVLELAATVDGVASVAGTVTKSGGWGIRV